MLINIRKNVIYVAFTIFAAAMTVITFKIPEGLPFKNPIDLSIILILMGFPLILAFYFLEAHYRYYLQKIVQTADKYEGELKLGVTIEDCKCFNFNKGCNKVASISKCLKCLHDYGMESHIRSANFNIYAYLLGVGFITLNFLISIKIGLTTIEILRFSIVTVAFTISILYLYTSRSIKKYEEKNELDKSSWVYHIPIILFLGFTYYFYYRTFNPDINIMSFVSIFVRDNFSYFNLPYIKALVFSSITFLALNYRKKILNIISCAIKTVETHLTFSQK
ncbi:MAG: hypothetical protein FIB08_15740 [Candidatus Methanoperedens sp.]|nr:hypothetical protein [Candidatus Methanoperedens sp.]